MDVQNGDTSLHIAAAMGRRKLTRLLVECGTDPEVRNKQGETAGEIAVRSKLILWENIEESEGLRCLRSLDPCAPQARIMSFRVYELMKASKW